MKVRRIANLNKHSKTLGGTILGIEADSGMTQKTREVIKIYKLDYELKSTGTKEMLQTVDQKIKKQEPIVFHAWQPHWMFAKYDLRMLSDDNRIFQKEGIRKLARPGFREDHKKAAKILEKIALTRKQFNSLLLYVKESNQEPKAAVAAWMEANPKIVKPMRKSGFSLF